MQMFLNLKKIVAKNKLATIGTSIVLAGIVTTGVVVTKDVNTYDAVVENTSKEIVEKADLSWLVRTAPAVTPEPSTTSTPATTGETTSPPTTVPSENVTVVVPKTVVTQSEVLALVQKYFPENQVSNAMAVAECESSQTSLKGPTNGDGTTDWGIFQLNDGGTLQGALRRTGIDFKTKTEATTHALNPEINVKAAGAIYQDRGWAPWVCAYKQQIVAKLYTNEKGQNYGKYVLTGEKTVPPTKKPKPVKPGPPTKPTKPTKPAPPTKPPTVPTVPPSTPPTVPPTTPPTTPPTPDVSPSP